MEKINIQIDKPCSENFNTFIKTDKGGFCNSCKKNVVDFTKMNDQEILKYFSIEKNKTCGMFLESQLKNYPNANYSISKQKPNPFFSGIFGISLLSLLSFTNSYSQEKTIKNEIVKEENIVSNKDYEKSDFDNKITVTGIISNEIGPIIGANVYLKNYNISTQTDVNGKFTFPKQLKIGDVLIVSYIGYKNKEIIVSRENQSDSISYIIKLDNFERIMLGEVSTNKVYKSKRTLIQKIKTFFTNE